MCILCVIQKWSRRIATMLPWLVIPLIGLWALSQLLPPAFRFEITSPRLACVLVLLVTLFWYEVLMPQLSVWRVKRNARLRERKRSEAIEMQKLRKTATRRCRNCLTAYRDQNPGGGKFMCSYCGHISKRPVLDLPAPSGMGNPGILKDLVGKGGKIINGKAWSDNGWACGQDWQDNGNWGGGQFSGNSNYWKKNGGGLFAENDPCLAEKSYSRVFIFACKALATILFSTFWLWRKIFRSGSSRDSTSVSEDHEKLNSHGENGGTGQESRVEKARRKAEERRQARLEKELLEEEERKQREEVARLVEERRRLRDEKMEAEKDSLKRFKERESKKESERKRHEKKKEKDRGSSKSNSDGEELDKRSVKESVRKHETDRREQRSTPESVKSPEIVHGFKSATNNPNRGNAGTRYLDRMRGTFLSSSRAFTGGGFFGKSVNMSLVSREQKPYTVVENAQIYLHKKEVVQPDRNSGKSNTNGEEKSAFRPVLIEAQQQAPKKSWQQLFTRTPAVSPPSSTPAVSPPSSSNVISRPTGNFKTEFQSPHPSGYTATTQSFDDPIDFGLSSPFSLPSFSLSSTSSSTFPPLSSEPMLPKMRDSPDRFLPEESEIFEDPCYVPDSISLLGRPVSESLNNFQLDLGFVSDAVMTNALSSESTKPSPIESPFSRSRVSDERHASSFLFPRTPGHQANPNNVSDSGTWQMWNSSPLVQDGLGFVGGPVNWLHPEMNLPNKEENIHPVPHKTMASLFKKDEQGIHGSHSSQNGGMFNRSVPATIDDPSWLPETFFSPFSNLESQNGVRNSLIYGNSIGPTANSWPK